MVDEVSDKKVRYLADDGMNSWYLNLAHLDTLVPLKNEVDNTATRLYMSPYLTIQLYWYSDTQDISGSPNRSTVPFLRLNQMNQKHLSSIAPSKSALFTLELQRPLYDTVVKVQIDSHGTHVNICL